VDEIEQAGCVPLPAYAVKAKAIRGNVNKINKLDAAGLATLPTVPLRVGFILFKESEVERVLNPHNGYAHAYGRSRFDHCPESFLVLSSITLSTEVWPCPSPGRPWAATGHGI
jgi:hypothetical protein